MTVIKFLPGGLDYEDNRKDTDAEKFGQNLKDTSQDLAQKTDFLGRMNEFTRVITKNVSRGTSAKRLRKWSADLWN